MDYNDPTQLTGLVRAARATGTVVERLRRTLRMYDATMVVWHNVNAEAEARGDAPTVKECERYSESLELHAHAFAGQVRELFEILSTGPALVAEPLGGPIPGVNGDLPEHGDTP